MHTNMFSFLEALFKLSLKNGKKAGKGDIDTKRAENEAKPDISSTLFSYPLSDENPFIAISRGLT